LNGYAGSRLADFEFIIGNEDQFIQVFLDITKNAIEAMSMGGKLTVITSMSDLFNSRTGGRGKYRLMSPSKESDMPDRASSRNTWRTIHVGLLPRTGS